MIGFLFGAVCLPVWERLYKRIGKRKAWQFQSLYNGFSNLVFLIPLGGNYSDDRLRAHQRLPSGTIPDGLHASRRHRLPDALWREADGVFASTAYFVPKAVGAFDALPLTIIYSAGFAADEWLPRARRHGGSRGDGCGERDDVQRARHPQPAADRGCRWVIRLLTGLLPAVASLLARLLAFYPRPEHMADVHATIEQLGKQPDRPVADPVTGTMITC